MLDIYILIGKEVRFLNYQIESIRQHVIGDYFIHLVTGPFVKILHNIRLEVQDEDDIDVIEIPVQQQFIDIFTFRVHAIIQYIYHNFIESKKDNNSSMILHADTFLIHDFDPLKYQEYNLVGRAFGNKGWIMRSNTWIMFNHNKKHEYSERSRLFKGYGFQDTFIGDRTDIFPNINLPYIPAQIMPPSFIHTDNIGKDSEENYLYKLEFIKQLYELQFPSLDDQILPQSFLSKTIRYCKEHAKWIYGGSQLRTPEQVEQIFKICSTCEAFDQEDEDGGHCGLCGCGIHRTDKTMNKAAWATTRCPMDPPKWIESAKAKGEKGGCGGCGKMKVNKRKK